ncbi:hypothetical protein [Allokutzneria oryzae]|uniref:DUF4333 domain-containing protein n=1 Tax=Allokutzneria oryzae TaxID=1378989 RepID=A0ABV5ZV34_9PSEU
MCAFRLTATVFTGLALLAACGERAPGGGSGWACPGIAARSGIGLDIEPPLAAKVAKASLNGKDIDLAESTKAVPATCTGANPQDSCQATMVPTGGKNGFLDVVGMATAPMRVSVRLLDAAGEPILEKDIELTPKEVFPHGPECGGGQPQAGVIVAADGTLRARG